MRAEGQASATVAELNGADTIQIRPAQPSDGAALMQAVARIDAETEFLGVPGQPHPWAGRPEAELRSLAQSGRGIVLLALRGDGAIVGYLSAFCGHFAHNTGSVFIAVIGLREGWRGQGIGTRLFEAVEDWARRRRSWRLELRVSSLNNRGQALYHKRGGWTDDLWMGKLLEPLPGELPDPVPLELARVRRPATVAPTIREMRVGDGAAFRTWEMQVGEAIRFSLKQPGEVASAEAIERDIVAVPSDPRLWLVATVPDPRRNERIVAFASGSIEFGYRMQYDCFVNVAVLPEWSGQGLGRALHDRVEAWGRGRDARRLTATIQVPNGAGRAFAAALGYDDEVTMRCYSLIDGRMVDRLRVGKLFGE